MTADRLSTARPDTAPVRGRASPATGRTRADIQGLRAIAVLVVIVFHAGLPLPGGFVGVDVFFVISGFVITGMLEREWETHGRIRFGRFYLRRFKRLTPALALVLVTTVLLSWVILSPLGPQQTVEKTALGAILISANLVITQASGDYFDAPAAANPLLHTWSLSVEEQFYLAFPLVLALAWWLGSRRARRWTAHAAVGLVAVVSFALTLWALDRELRTAGEALVGFYGPISRAWEFAVGALLALSATQVARLAGGARALAGATGAALLALSLLLISETTPFPGPWTLLPVVATLLLIVAGTGGDSTISRALSVRPMKAVGDWSYSLYLWHWPLIVFATVLWPGNDWAVVAAAAASLLPAVASYRWLETPIRQIGPLRPLPTTGLVAAVVVPVLAVSTGGWYVSEHVSRPSLEAERGPLTYTGEIAWKDHDYRFGGFEPCTSTTLRTMFEEAPNYEPRCQQSKPGADVELALVGDSHVEHLFIGVKDALPDTNVMYFTADAPLSLEDAQYAAALDYVVATPSIQTVLLTAFWGVRGVDQAALVDVARMLTDHGKIVVLTDDVPDFPFDPVACKYPGSRLVPRTCSIPEAEFETRHQAVVDALMAVQAQVPGVELLTTAQYLCPDDACRMTRGREILYADPSHLNLIGSRYVGSRMVADYPVLSGR